VGGEEINQQRYTMDNEELIDRVLKRRSQFDLYLKINNINLFTCPSCGFPTLSERNGYEICTICDWEDDGQDDNDATEVFGGPNGDLSLNDSRIKIESTFIELEKFQNGKVCDNPEFAMDILNKHDTEMSRLSSEIPFDAEQNHPKWKNWKKEREDVIKRLIVPSSEKK
jgi:hypothetical protein